ncbi:UNVERIFIED_CONTAM: hypothetical protein Sradi_2384400 [Sesamum radiatum]|uniref:Secreted protein n=1 Tax=Sesamum radiatum TaxID=300843 RepID=A0AAW2T9U5_SESRA
MHTARWMLLLNSLHFLGVHPNTSSLHNVPQETDSLLRKRALRHLCIQLVFTESRQNLPQMLYVLGQGSAVDNNIIEVHHHKFINVLKVAGAFVRPKGMTRNSEAPYLMSTVVFASSPSLIRTCQ